MRAAFNLTGFADSACQGRATRVAVRHSIEFSVFRLHVGHMGRIVRGSKDKLYEDHGLQNMPRYLNIVITCQKSCVSPSLAGIE